MTKTAENTQNELTGLQYSLDQIQLSKINIDLMFTTNTKEFEKSGKNSRQENQEKVTETSGFEYDEEIDGFLSHIDEVKKLDQKINDHLEDYLELFDPTHQSDFHFMLDALQNFVEWVEDYSNRMKSIRAGDISEKKIEEFNTSSEFLSLCCNWLSSTVSTVLKYGFDTSENNSV